VRAFIALEIGPKMRQAIAELQESLRPRVPGARFVRPEGIHLTLRFLGEARPDQVEVLRPALGTAARSCPPLEIRVRGLGTFPERGAPRVLWLGIEAPESVRALQRACETAAVGAGFAREGRPFRAHLTLARFRERVRRPELPPTELGTTGLSHLILFQSELKPGGAVYTPVARFALGRGAIH
jgi:2'-5' RNA ligase